MADSPFFPFFNTYPIVPLTLFALNIGAFIPICCLLWIAQIAPLHGNCRYILCAWVISFGAVYVMNIALAIVDLRSDTGYMARSMFEPHIRFVIYQWHLTFVTFCSSLEVVLSIERIMAIIKPRTYHFSKTAWKTLIMISILLMLFAYAVEVCFHSEESVLRRLGSILMATIEITILITGGVAMIVCRIRYERSYGKSSLTTRYQVKEAYEMCRAIMPAYIISFIIKASSIFVLCLYYLVRDDHGYVTGFVQAYILLMHVCNGTFSITNLLFKHPQLRIQMNRKCRSLSKVKPAEENKTDTAATDTALYFSMLSESWK